jgi:hypothetical protein
MCGRVVNKSILEGFREVVRQHGVGGGQVGNGPRDSNDSVKSAR